MAEKKEKKPHYDFGGPVGVIFFIFALPLVITGLYWWCNKTHCSPFSLPIFPALSEYLDSTTFLVLFGWFVFQVILYVSPLGYVTDGTELRNGKKLKYRFNGIHAYLISHVLLIIGYFGFNLPLGYLYDHYYAMAFTTIVFSFALSLFLYIKAAYTKDLLSVQGNTGYFFYDYFMGRELNPRTLGFDWKIFCEMRPGLIGWVFINYCMMAKEYELKGSVSTSMVLVCFFHFWYILDALWVEEAILTTMDIIHEGFGYMLVFGDLAWVPFTYTVQSRFLVDNPVDMPVWAAVAVFAFNALGYYIFRSANSTKNRFRHDPNHPSVRNLKTMQTKRGTKLIVSGMWGFCRHPNYVGDLIMGLAWCLPCGFTSPIPYYYIIYFTILLVHRQLRDETQCKKKYGEDWDKYCKIVRWRLFPGIY